MTGFVASALNERLTRKTHKAKPRGARVGCFL
jgi:hypothetical protein